MHSNLYFFFLHSPFCVCFEHFIFILRADDAFLKYFYRSRPGQWSSPSDIRTYRAPRGPNPSSYPLSLESCRSSAAKRTQTLNYLYRIFFKKTHRKESSTFCSRFVILCFWLSSCSCCSFTASTRWVMVFSWDSITFWKERRENTQQKHYYSSVRHVLYFTILKESHESNTWRKGWMPVFS